MLAQLLNGLALGSLLMILAAGLVLIYGLRGVVNFGHGALYLLGAYMALELSGRWGFWPALLIAPLLLVLVGGLLEMGVFRPLQNRELLEVGLVTFGIAMIVESLVHTVYGPHTRSVAAPPGLDGSLSIFGVQYPTFRLFLISIALGMSVLLWFWLQRTRMGLHVRAASHDGETSALMGVNTDRVSLAVVCAGAGLAGLAGTLASPYLAVEPAMGGSILILTFIVVIVGGLGSIVGAIIAALGLGFFQVLGSVWLPVVAPMIPYLLLIAVILFRPAGLAGKRIH